ncbi:MAG: hypothetical protein FWF38_07310 [Spirochaetaceae bacterium]|nr:hypothetical protein [Spirochaetaceae bacterium]
MQTAIVTLSTVYEIPLDTIKESLGIDNPSNIEIVREAEEIAKEWWKEEVPKFLDYPEDFVIINTEF